MFSGRKVSHSESEQLDNITSTSYKHNYYLPSVDYIEAGEVTMCCFLLAGHRVKIDPGDWHHTTSNIKDWLVFEEQKKLLYQTLDYHLKMDR